MENNIYDVIILGAGPAGLFCVSNILKKFSVLILEKSDSPAKKLLLSAKGRGNITNANINPKNDYVSDDSNFVASAFKKYGVKDFLKFLKDEGIEVKRENGGRILLKSDNVKQFHVKLLKYVTDNGVEIKYNSEFLSIDRINDIFKIETTGGTYLTKNFIVATGGSSFPKLGATNIALNIADNFGLGFIPFYPALVGFETEQDFSSLSGSSIIGKLKLLKGNQTIYEEIGPILFTHRGISGPTVFNTSLFIRGNFKKMGYSVKIFISTKEITKRLLIFLGFRSNKINEYIISSNIKDVRGLDEAKVCGGGIKTDNLNYNFECKSIPGLYFIGECVDVTGKTGGFNLQRCWTSAAVCANGINKKVKNL